MPWLVVIKDIRVADFSVGAVFSQNVEGNWEAETSNVPYSGTAVNKLEQPIVDDLVEQYSDDVVQLGFALGDYKCSYSNVSKTLWIEGNR